MKSRVACIIPPKKIFSSSYPLGLAYIASVLRQNNNEVIILGDPCGRNAIDKIVRDIAGFAPDFLLITVYSFNYPFVKPIINKAKNALPGLKVILGGPHISALPEFSLEDTGADFAVVGEGEYVTVEIIRRVEDGDSSFEGIKGLAFLKNGVPTFNPGCNLVNDLETLPMPARELIPSYNWKDIAGQISPRAAPVAPIITSRGCPHQCTFCASRLVHGNSFRKRSPLSVADEVEYLVRKFGVKEINFFDDTFSEDRMHAIDICREISRRRLGIFWRTTVGLRLDTLDDEMVSVFKESGCYELAFGIESLSAEVLRGAKKPIIRSHISDKVRMVRRHGIETFGYFILGLPGDTERSLRETIKFARDSELDYLSFTHAVPLPGTDIFSNRYKGYDLKGIQWDRFYFYGDHPFDISEVGPSRLKMFYRWAYITSYLKPRRLRLVLISAMWRKNSNVSKLLRFIFYLTKNLF